MRLPCPKCGRMRPLKGLWIVGEARPQIMCRPCSKKMKILVTRAHQQASKEMEEERTNPNDGDNSGFPE